MIDRTRAREGTLVGESVACAPNLDLTDRQVRDGQKASLNLAQDGLMDNFTIGLSDQATISLASRLDSPR